MLFFPLRFWRIRSNLKYGDSHAFRRKPSGKQAELDTKMKNVKIYLLLFLFLAISVPRCWAEPDLYISESDISFSTDYPDSGQEFTISATVHNSGTGYSERIFAKNPEEGQPELYEVALSTDVWLAQSFQCTEDVNLTGVSLYIKDIGVNDSLTVTIETNTASNVPSGSSVVTAASTTVNSSDVWWYWIDFTFPGLVPLSADTTYWIVTHNYALGVTDGYSIIQTSYNYYASGIEVYSRDKGSTWTEWKKRDLLFKAYRSTTTIVEFYDGDPDLGGTSIGTDEISPVPAGGSVIASILISTTAGSHDIYAYVNRDNYIVEQDTANNKAYKTIFVDFPRVMSAETIDDDLDGCIDAYHIVFDEAIDDSTLIQTSTCGFVVAGYSGLKVLTTLASHFDVVNDTDIYLCFTESGVPDTGLLPEVTYSSTTGRLADLEGYLLLDIGPSEITKVDGTSPVVHSLLSFPQNGALGISIDSSIEIIFAENMDVDTTTGAIKVEAIVNKDGETITPPQTISGSFSSSYDENRHKFIFQPVSPFKNNYTYQVTVSTTATDTNGHNLALSEFSFTTISNYKESNTFVSDGSKMKIILDAGTLKENFFVRISTSSLIDSPRRTNIIDANNKLDIDDDPFSFALKPTVVEIEAFDADGNPITDTFEIPATITLSYEDNNPEDGIVDGTSPPLREKTLKVYWLNESHSLWVKLSDSEVDTNSNRVSARTFHFSIFSLHGMGATDLSDAYAYPVPFIPSRGDTDITFTNISPLCTIKIYTLNGELVRTIEHTSGATSYSWDVTNDRGDRLGSGVCLYLIKDAKNKKKGKLIIIR